LKKTIFAVIVAALCGIAQAEGTYASVTYDQKDKQSSTQVNHVYGLNVGQKFADGWSAEVRMEDEKVTKDGTQTQEGLAQLKVSKDFTFGFVTPYVAAAVGQKNKSTSDFPFWLAEVGAKVKLGDSLTARYGYRQRTAFDTTANSYDTTEHTVAPGYSVTKQDAVSVAYKQERGTSNYNTTGLYYTRSF
jgi:hypothetical protein